MKYASVTFLHSVRFGFEASEHFAAKPTGAAITITSVRDDSGAAFIDIEGPRPDAQRHFVRVPMTQVRALGKPLDAGDFDAKQTSLAGAGAGRKGS
jgi:hypothetical protein